MTTRLSRPDRERAVAASAAGYAAWAHTRIGACPYGSDAPTERLWWVRGWLARLGDEPPDHRGDAATAILSPPTATASAGEWATDVLHRLGLEERDRPRR